MIEEALIELREIIFRVHHFHQMPEPDRRSVSTGSMIGALGSYRPRDRDYWVDVAETLDAAQDIEYRDDMGDLHERQIRRHSPTCIPSPPCVAT